jgi:molybdenum cofactor cytidylyltransferase
MKVSAIILAAGESKRMGRDKLLLDFGGETLIERVVGALVRSKVDRILVLAGANSGKIRKLFRGRKALVVRNRKYKEGMAASIREGLRHIDPETHGVLIALGDHPFLTTEVIDQLIDGYRKTEKGIVYPVFEGKPGHPVIFNLKRYGKALADLKGDVGGRSVVQAHPEDVFAVVVDSSGVISDIDRVKEYEESLRLFAKGTDKVTR